MEVLGTVIGTEHLTGLGQQGLDRFPDPLGSITNDAQAHLLFRHQARCFDVLEGFALLLLIVYLMPPQQMDDAVSIEEVEAKALRVAPLAAPQRPLGPLAALAGTRDISECTPRTLTPP
jgi:hypothetical protein